jgi:hypothetical protein
MSRMLASAVLLTATFAHAAERTLVPDLHHLRNGDKREWIEFPERAEAAHLEQTFDAKANANEQTLELRQQDLKQTWNLVLNGKRLARLPRDENDMRVYYPLPADSLKDGKNTLRVDTTARGVDDIRIGEIILHDRPRNDVLSEVTVSVTVLDTDSKRPLPSRITIVDENGTLASTSAESNKHLAVRPGTVYTSIGKATFGLPAGKYTLYAGRGVEYGLASTTVTLKTGEKTAKTLSIRREVPTAGYVACDTHVHTLTHSGHGDSTLTERMITLAAEGIEFPIATDHNKHISYETIARQLGVRRYFTPVVGNEVTTKVGHFNVFPARTDVEVPDYRLGDWKAIFASIYSTPDVKVAILNHARDVHGGVTPFGPKLHNAVTGENLECWILKANAMELVNSSAQQTDIMRLYHDWFGMLNRGFSITPVGSSDSHDVARHFVGQGRTYIRCNDSQIDKIDILEATNSFTKGRVNVSCGLLCEITVNGRYQPGDLVPKSKTVEVSARVLGPSWTRAEIVELYANGRKIREAKINDKGTAGVKWEGNWEIPNLKQDVHLVAIARGPGVRKPYWAFNKPYQPTSPVWRPVFLGSTGAVWIDADGNGRRTSAYDDAKRLVAAAKGKTSALAKSLVGYDNAVAAQVASLLDKQKIDLAGDDVRQAFRSAGPLLEQGLLAYLEARRASRIARSASQP